jgi:hypothetical protein
MRVRHDAVFVSCVLFTVALLWLAPHNLEYASTWREFGIPVGHAFEQNFLMPIGFASLALILVGLIVTWTYYIKRERWAWFIMFTIVWVFAFPVYVLPIIQARVAEGSVGWPFIWDAIKRPGTAGAAIKGPVDFVLLLIALLIPLRSFFAKRF